MKIKVMLKDPDVLIEAIADAVEDRQIHNLTKDQAEVLKEKLNDDYYKLASKWFQWGEYLQVELDTDEQTIRVIPVEEYEND